MTLISKSEFLISKQYPISNALMFKNCGYGIWDLFRISIFELRYLKRGAFS